MICDICRKAGDYNQLGSSYKAKMLHGECKGCDCQHRIGEGHINEERVTHGSSNDKKAAREISDPAREFSSSNGNQP